MKRNGFTLIELMIVVAIIGIVLSLILPVVNGQVGREGPQDTSNLETPTPVPATPPASRTP